VHGTTVDLFVDFVTEDKIAVRQSEVEQRNNVIDV